MNQNRFQKIVVVFSLFICMQVACQDLVLSRSSENTFSDGSSPIGSARTDDLEDIELGVAPALTADDLMPLISKSRNITKKERRTHIERVLQRAQTRSGKNTVYLSELQMMVLQKKRGMGLPINVEESHISPALEWLGKKVLKQDVELLNTKFDRQKIITGFSAVGAFLISSGLACLTAYLGSLYS